MKKLILPLFLAFFSNNLMAQQTGIIFSDPIDVSNGDYSYRGPKIGLSNNDIPVVLWGDTDDGAPKYWVSKLENNNFSTPSLASGTIPAFINSAEGGTFVVKGDFIYLTFSPSDEDGVWLSSSLDGGETFNLQSVIEVPEDRHILVPAVGIRSDNQAVVSYISTNLGYGDAQMEVVQSSGFGTIFSDPAIANTAASNAFVCECCPAALLVEENFQFLLFRNNDNNLRDNWIAKSSDNGLTFDEALDVDPIDWTINACPATGPDGIKDEEQLLSVWKSNGEGSSQVYLSTADVNSMTFLEVYNLSEDLDSYSHNYPRIAGNADTIGVVWQSYDGFYNQISFAWSVNGPADLVNHVETISLPAGSLKFPDIEFEHSVFHIVYENFPDHLVNYVRAEIGMVDSVDDLNPFGCSVHPNPAQEHMTITFDNPYSKRVLLELVDVNGKVIFKDQVNAATYLLSRKNWSAGQYFLNITIDNHQITKAIVFE